MKCKLIWIVINNSDEFNQKVYAELEWEYTAIRGTTISADANGYELFKYLLSFR